jgi:hypothetical protein
MLRSARRQGDLRHIPGKHIKRNPVGDRARELRVEQVLQESDRIACSILDPDHPHPPEGGIPGRLEVVVEKLRVAPHICGKINVLRWKPEGLCRQGELPIRGTLQTIRGGSQRATQERKEGDREASLLGQGVGQGLLIRPPGRVRRSGQDFPGAEIDPVKAAWEREGWGREIRNRFPEKLLSFGHRPSVAINNDQGVLLIR